MNKLKSVFCVLGMALIVSSSALAAGTEEKDHSNRDENGKVVRGPYHTNKFGDNWFIGLSAGFNTFMQMNAGYKAGWSECVEFDFGKWFIPTFGLRVGYQGFRGFENFTQPVTDNSGTKEKFGFAYVHADALWNISHTIGGYRRDRTWNFVPYAHLGFIRLYDVNNPDSGVNEFNVPRRTNDFANEFAFGAGLLNLIRVHERVNLTLDGRVSTFSGRFHDWDLGHPLCHVSATFGLQVLLGRTDWGRCEGHEDNAAIAEAAAALAAAKALGDALTNDKKDLEDSNDAIAAANDSLRNQIERLLENPADTTVVVDTVYIEGSADTAPFKLYFEINISDLNILEKDHLDYYVETVINQDPDRVFYVIGTADSGTGNKEINTRLSNERAKKTIEFLKSHYGISEDRIKFRDARIVDTPDGSDPGLDRSVIIEY